MRYEWKDSNTASFDGLVALLDTMTMSKTSKRVGEAVAVQAETTAEIEKVSADLDLSEKRMAHAIVVGRKRNELATEYYSVNYMKLNDSQKKEIDAMLGIG